MNTKLIENESKIQNAEASSKLIIALAASLMLAISVGVYYYYQTMTLNQQLQDLQIASKDGEVPENSNASSQENVLMNKQIEYVKQQILPRYPELLAELEPNAIEMSQPISLANSSTGWFIKTKDTQESVGYYLVTEKVQKKLGSVFSAVAGEDCGNVATKMVYLQNNSKNTLGYLIVHGNNCTMFGIDESTSVFSLDTGTKVPLVGVKVPLPDSMDKRLYNIATSPVKDGNAWGDFLGVYGPTNPQLVFQYSYYIAFFDLESGQLVNSHVFK